MISSLVGDIASFVWFVFYREFCCYVWECCLYLTVRFFMVSLLKGSDAQLVLFVGLANTSLQVRRGRVGDGSGAYRKRCAGQRVMCQLELAII